MPRNFLTASWKHLIVASYRMPRELLTPFLPPGTRLDEFDGSAWASLVGFEFLDTRVLGIPWPGYRDFPEWNLRFYVRHGEDHGVTFVREFVPKWLIAAIARSIYNEPYRKARIESEIKTEPDLLQTTYRIHYGGRAHTLQVSADPQARRPEAGSLPSFLIDQRWGFGANRRGTCIRYEVTHPAWEIHPVRESSIDVDWVSLYGEVWRPMNERKPDCVLFVKGSEVSVSPLGSAST